jgi:hypothetical protein
MNRARRKPAPLGPYLFHFAIFVTVFFFIIGGALFVINFASAYTA